MQVLAAHWKPETGWDKNWLLNLWVTASAREFKHAGVAYQHFQQLFYFLLKKPHTTWDPFKMQPPPQNLHLTLTRCQYCKTFHLRSERWVSRCIIIIFFPLKASLMASCYEFLMQCFWTQMYFKMNKLLTPQRWVEQWFSFTTRGVNERCNCDASLLPWLVFLIGSRFGFILKTSRSFPA